MSDGVKHYNSDSKTIARRERVIERLQDQLKAGTKTAKKTGESLQLTTKDVERIQRELETIKSRLI
jgi:hypothetical protein